MSGFGLKMCVSVYIANDLSVVEGEMNGSNDSKPNKDVRKAVSNLLVTLWIS